MTFSFNCLTTPTLPALLRIAGGFLLFATVFAGCATRRSYVIDELHGGHSTRAADITIVESPEPQDYRVVGRVHVHSRVVKWLPCLLPSHNQLTAKLKREAALLGADVIFDIKRYSRSQFEWREEHLMATAAIILKKEAGDGL